jgi:hypothetical protein
MTNVFGKHTAFDFVLDGCVHCNRTASYRFPSTEGLCRVIVAELNTTSNADAICLG